jgi:hypothetical protein
VPKRNVPTDRAGMNAGLVEAAAAAQIGLDRCRGFITEPAHRDAAGRKRPASTRPCGQPLDPVLALAGFTTHPCCDPGETSPDCPPMAWPDAMLKRPRKTVKARPAHA